MNGRRVFALSSMATLAMLASVPLAQLEPPPPMPPPPDLDPDDAHFARRLDPSRDERPRRKAMPSIDPVDELIVDAILRGCPDHCGLDCPHHGPMARKLARRAARALAASAGKR